jgi:hypothetical protein
MGIFDDQTTDLFIRYRARLQFRGRVAGGTPSDPKLIEAWLRRQTGVTDVEEIRAMTVQTLIELGVDAEVFGEDADPTLRFETISQVAELIAKKSKTTMFKRDEVGLYIENRGVKAMLKECVNVLYASKERADRWGPTGKGPRSATAEWVFVDPPHISLGRTEPDGVELSIGHIVGPQGPRSTLDYYEYVEGAIIDFDVMVLKDRVDQKHWPEIWRYAQESGLGAKRSQGLGTFDIVGWDRLNGGH